jgi:lipid-A-disaccharide synthase
VKYYIISGEASGDLHGSKLIEALKKKDIRAQIRCWGGDLMQNSGGKLVKHYKELAFMGFWEVITNLKTILSNIKFCKKDILAFSPDVIIYIDYPGFNLRISKWAKKKGFKNHFYISPQVWAWKENRVHQMKRDLDEVYVILPFEKEFFEEKHQFSVKYVGHPLLDRILQLKKSTGFLTKNQLSETKPLIALLPGSRLQEIKKILPNYLTVTKFFPKYEFVIAGAPGISPHEYAHFLKDEEVKLIYNQTHDLLMHSKAALVSSGTATLETALFNVPQVVCYRSSFLSYHIAKRLVKLEFISLVNLILNREVVKELIQNSFTPYELKKQMAFILSDDGQKKLKADYQSLRLILGKGGASKKTAELIFKAIR